MEAQEYSGRLTVHSRGANKKSRGLNIKTYNDIMKTPIAVTYDGECLTIKRVGISYLGKTQTPNKGASDWYKLTVSLELPLGNFVFDSEESDCDTLVCYFDEQ